MESISGFLKEIADVTYDEIIKGEHINSRDTFVIGTLIRFYEGVEEYEKCNILKNKSQSIKK